MRRAAGFLGVVVSIRVLRKTHKSVRIPAEPKNSSTGAKSQGSKSGTLLPLGFFRFLLEEDDFLVF